ncbi:ATP-binding protein [Streptomyces nanhaiensis]|uniref:ATP-binding protein n=1 Tax=Streptomyces nanhaiensis TaxID=679319 RepID=UPI00399D3C39
MSPLKTPAPQRNQPVDHSHHPEGNSAEPSGKRPTDSSAPGCHIPRDSEGVKVTSLLPHTNQAPGLARRYVRAALETHLEPELLDNTLLVITEMVTNAVQHALPPVILEVRHTYGHPKAIHIEVTDTGPNPRAVRLAKCSSQEENGRGNNIIAALSAENGTRLHSGTATRWAYLTAAEE